MTISHARTKIIRLVSLPLITIFITIFLPTILSAASKVTIKEIKYQSFKEYTRITIYLSGSVEFMMKHLSGPERLYFDLKNTILSKKIKPAITIENGTLKAIRTRQFSKDTVRIVFDLYRTEDFKASFLNKKNPRLVVDIYASKAKKVEITPPQPAKTDVRPSEPPRRLDITPSPQEDSEKVITPPVKPETPIGKKDDVASLISSGEKYTESGEHEKALLDFMKAAEINPNNAEIYVHIGRSLFKLGKREDAFEAYKQALKNDPNSADAYNGLGYSYYAAGKPGSAVEAFLMAIKLNPDHDDAHAGLGYTYLTTGDISSAMEQYRILKALESDKADELFSLIFKVKPQGQEKLLR
jgi:tetratricopeptide (TPR) repeat protein